MSLVYVMPKVEVGQVVLWSYGRGEKPSPAVVTAVGQGTISCACHVESVKDHILKTGVRHCDDPFVQARPQHDAGVWELTPRDARINLVLADLDRLLAGGVGAYAGGLAEAEDD